ncbi:hypothetical protein CQA57_06970 [Helicobacter anseris]|uniref:Uncharacterized protein n=1 Tax=Helicobacter anseris TaxID=375926 RepID=A0A3D8J4A5_9HELI|nr:hypothetical protein [Helicobacter anseris]RDU72337.1 hypothetical protein CQA57_06970 [Helicobacter anseris]
MDFLIALLFGIFISYLEDKKAQEDLNDKNLGMTKSDDFRILVFIGVFIGAFCAEKQTIFFVIGYLGHPFIKVVLAKINKKNKKV